jgi:O-antigen ligase
MLLRLSYLPNIKSLWVRLLAETGLVGFSTFLGWLYVLWRSTRLMMRSKRLEFRAIALAGQLSLIAFIVEGFSIDSFAMPYLWVMAGIVSAAGMVYRRSVTMETAGNLEDDKVRTTAMLSPPVRAGD